jgi:hypothetical protein
MIFGPSTAARANPRRCGSLSAVISAKSHAPATAAGIVDAVRRLLKAFEAGVQDDTGVLAFGVPSGGVC